MNLNLTLPFFSAVVIALVISFVSFKSSAPNADDHNAVINKISLLKHANTILNDTLFEIASNKSNDYDEISAGYRRLSDGFSELNNSETRVGHVKDSDFNQKIVDLGVAVVNKGRLIENIKTDHALLRNSLDYYPLLVKEIESISDRNQIYEKLVRLMNVVMYYVLNGDESWFFEAKTLIAGLKNEIRNNSQIITMTNSNVVSFLAHSEVILNGKYHQIIISSIENEIPLNESIDLLSRSYMTHYSEKAKSADVYRQIMFFSSVLLVLIVLYMLIKNARHSQELAASRASFLANMSHEIRTPLTAIIGFGEATLESRQSMTERLSAVRSIVRNGKHLLSVINEILDVSKVESGKLETEVISVDVAEILIDVESVVRMQIAEKGLVFKLKYYTPVPNKIFTDPVRLKQILLNICGNAVKFTKQGKIEVGVSYLAGQHKITFSVIDSGIGITKQQAEKLFKPFSQADSSTTRKFGGTGLGLHISRELAKLLGGDITVVSLAGQGAQFDIVIDTGALDDVMFSGEPPQFHYQKDAGFTPIVAPLLKGTVLLAEDSIDNQKLISYQIHKTGASVVIADNGKIALDIATENEFDLILMDMQMPEMDGIEATEKLRKSDYTNPIVALTANAFNEDVLRCRASGCDDFLSKPVDWKRFFQVLETYLQTDEPTVADETPLISEMLDGDPEIEAFIQSLVDDLPGRLTQINQSYKDKDWLNFKEHLHKLKGTLGSFGYQQVSELAARMEFELKKQGYAELDISMGELSRLISRIVKGRPA